MSGYPPDQISSPPELPSYLKEVYDLKPLVGVPSHEEMIGIHAVMRMARKAVDIPGMHDPTLLSRLHEHLFDAQMARYRGKYPCNIFHVDTTYTPPVLPTHVSAQLEPVSGIPSEEEVAKVQDVVHAYQKFAEILSMFDPKVHAELSQHLFDVQMARYLYRCGRATPVSLETTTARVANTFNRIERTSEEINTATNNSGSGAETTESYQPAQPVTDSAIRSVLERSNQLAERSNQLIERSNQIAEQLTRVVEQSNQPAEPADGLVNKLTELFGRMDEHLQQSNRLAEMTIKPVDTIGDLLKDINKVLVGIQHAIVRNHKGNTLATVDCLVNEGGETPLEYYIGLNFSSLSSVYASDSKLRLRMTVNGAPQDFYLNDVWVGIFLRFFGIGEGLREGSSLKKGSEASGRSVLAHYFSSRLG